MSGKQAKNMRRQIKKHIKWDYDRFLGEIKGLDFNDRLNIALALVFKVDDVWKGKAILYGATILLIAIGFMVNFIA